MGPARAKVLLKALDEIADLWSQRNDLLHSKGSPPSERDNKKKELNVAYLDSIKPNTKARRRSIRITPETLDQHADRLSSLADTLQHHATRK